MRPAFPGGLRFRDRALAALAAVVWSVLAGATSIPAQVIEVGLTAVTNRSFVGEPVLVQASAQILPAYRDAADRIFSWYLDLLTTGAVAQIQGPDLRKPASDNNPMTSSQGTPEAGAIRGIYDTFLDLPAAGRDSPVVLFTVPVTAQAPGRVIVYLQPGSGVAEFNEDFLVARKDGMDPLTGGSYQQATVELEFVQKPQPPLFSISLSYFTPGDHRYLVLRYPVAEGWNYFVETRDSLAPGNTWQLLKATPENSGALLLTNSNSATFYRVTAKQ